MAVSAPPAAPMPTRRRAAVVHAVWDLPALLAGPPSRVTRRRASEEKGRDRDGCWHRRRCRLPRPHAHSGHRGDRRGPRVGPHGGAPTLRRLRPPVTPTTARRRDGHQVDPLGTDWGRGAHHAATDTRGCSSGSRLCDVWPAAPSLDPEERAALPPLCCQSSTGVLPRRARHPPPPAKAQHGRGRLVPPYVARRHDGGRRLPPRPSRCSRLDPDSVLAEPKTNYSQARRG